MYGYNIKIVGFFSELKLDFRFHLLSLIRCPKKKCAN